MALNLIIAILNTWIPLTATLLNDHIVLFRLLPIHGVSVHITDNDVRTPLRAAASKCHLDVTREMQRNGGIVHVDSWTALLAAAKSCLVEVT
jgi:ankyrin repeat protein